MATYVLVHGAYQGGWIWKQVAERLRAAGHEVYAPTLEGCGERHDQVRPGITVGTHAHEVARLLFYEDLEDVVLVGTSSGGMVICQVTELAGDRISRLVHHIAPGHLGRILSRARAARDHPPPARPTLGAGRRHAGVTRLSSPVAGRDRERTALPARLAAGVPISGRVGSGRSSTRP